MKPLAHLLSSLILALSLIPILKWNALLVLAGGFLIDIDHHFWYVYRYRKINIFKAYKFFIKPMDEKNFKSVAGILLIFHTAEFLLIMLALSYISKIALAFTIGLLLHYALDLCYLYFVARGFVVNHSIIYWIYREKIQKL
ncbi:hypothetical protein HYX05_03555 [Candidatus Woesearchaeota archaeon]|nr:hypothetical protein [Candidatus Woesearchaeota archaeon]